MIDIGVTKIAIIGGIALIVIGPEKLPGLAKTIGTLLGRARRYVADVKAEVNRSMDLDELKKMKETVESAARDVEQSIQSGTSDFEKNWSEATSMASDLTSGSTLAPPPPTRHAPPSHSPRITRHPPPLSRLCRKACDRLMLMMPTSF